MPKTYNDDHLVDEFGRVIPYDSLEGAFPKGVSNEVKRATLEKNDWYRNDGSYVEGSKVKTYLDDTYGIYGETKKAGEGRKLYLGDIHAHYHKDTGVGEICTNVITDKNDLKEKPRFISARINEKQYNEYMSSGDADRIRLAAEYLPEIRLESTRNRIAQVGNIGVAEGKDGSYVMTADIDGEKIQRTITDQQRDKFLALEDTRREKYFAKTFDCKGVKSVPGAKDSVSDQIMNAVVDNKGQSKGISKDSGLDMAKNDTKNLNTENVSVKASQIAAASFDSIEQSSNTNGESIKTGMSR